MACLPKIDVWFCRESGDLYAYSYKPVDGYELRTPHLDKGTGEITTRIYRRYTLDIPDKEEECSPTD